MTNAKKVVKRVKKVDPKAQAKKDFSAKFVEFLRNEGVEVDTANADYGFTGGTLVIKDEKTDVQVKFITPKAGLDRYQKIEYVDELDEDEDEGSDIKEIE